MSEVVYWGLKLIAFTFGGAGVLLLLMVGCAEFKEETDNPSLDNIGTLALAACFMILGIGIKVFFLL